MMQSKKAIGSFKIIYLITKCLRRPFSKNFSVFLKYMKKAALQKTNITLIFQEH